MFQGRRWERVKAKAKQRQRAKKGTSKEGTGTFCTNEGGWAAVAALGLWVGEGGGVEEFPNA